MWSSTKRFREEMREKAARAAGTEEDQRGAEADQASTVRGIAVPRRLKEITLALCTQSGCPCFVQLRWRSVGFSILLSHLGQR